MNKMKEEWAARHACVKGKPCMVHGLTGYVEPCFTPHGVDFLGMVLCEFEDGTLLAANLSEVRFTDNLYQFDFGFMRGCKNKSGTDPASEVTG